MQEVRGEWLQKQDALIADDTGTMALTVWGNLVNTFEEKQFYELHNVTTNLFNNEKLLSTNKQTTINQAKEITNVKSDTREASNATTVTTSIMQVKVTEVKNCAVCKKKLEVPEDSNFARCSSCNMKVRVKDLTQNNIIAILCIKDDKKNIIKLTAYHGVLSKFLTEIIREDLKENAELFEEYLLNTENLKITYGQNHVVQSITTCTQ